MGRDCSREAIILYCSIKRETINRGRAIIRGNTVLTCKDVSFEWSLHRFLSKDLKVTSILTDGFIFNQIRIGSVGCWGKGKIRLQLYLENNVLEHVREPTKNLFVNFEIPETQKYIVHLLDIVNHYMYM